MKTLLFLSMLFLTNQSIAQITFGEIPMTIKTGSSVSIQGLNLQPSTDLTLQNNSLTLSTTPAPTSPNASIKRVYRFSAPINFSGVAMIGYQVSELNDNTESKLQLAHTSDEVNGFTVTTGSTVDATNHYVSNTISNNNLLALTAISSGGALPVTLVDFIATAEGQAALLDWSTSSESNSDRFEIEHSLDVKSWSEIGNLAANGESSTTSTYHFIHNNVADGLNYYRLKMIDKDGSFARSSIRSVIFRFGETTIIFPNPASERLRLKDLSNSNISEVHVYDVSGKQVYNNVAFPNEGIALADLVAGSYVLKIKRENGQQTSHTFVKQ